MLTAFRLVWARGEYAALRHERRELARENVEAGGQHGHSRTEEVEGSYAEQAGNKERGGEEAGGGG